MVVSADTVKQGNKGFCILLLLNVQNTFTQSCRAVLIFIDKKINLKGRFKNSTDKGRIVQFTWYIFAQRSIVVSKKKAFRILPECFEL